MSSREFCRALGDLLHRIPNGGSLTPLPRCAQAGAAAAAGSAAAICWAAVGGGRGGRNFAGRRRRCARRPEFAGWRRGCGRGGGIAGWRRGWARRRSIGWRWRGVGWLSPRRLRHLVARASSASPVAALDRAGRHSPCYTTTSGRSPRAGRCQAAPPALISLRRSAAASTSPWCGGVGSESRLMSAFVPRPSHPTACLDAAPPALASTAVSACSSRPLPLPPLLELCRTLDLIARSMRLHRHLHGRRELLPLRSARLRHQCCTMTPASSSRCFILVVFVRPEQLLCRPTRLPCACADLDAGAARYRSLSSSRLQRSNRLSTSAATRRSAHPALLCILTAAAARTAARARLRGVSFRLRVGQTARGAREQQTRRTVPVSISPARTLTR